MIYIYSNVLLHWVNDIKFKASRLWNQLSNELKQNQNSSSFELQFKKVYTVCLVN